MFCDCNVWTWSTRSTTGSPLISPLSLALLFVHSDMFKTYPKQFGRIVADQMSWPTDQRNMLSVECVRFCFKGCRVSMIVRIMLVLLLYNHHNYCSSQACLGASRVYTRAGCGGEGHVQQGPAISFVALRKAISSLWIFLFLLDCDWCLITGPLKAFCSSIVHIACVFLRPVSLEPASRYRKSKNSTNTLSAKLGVAGGLKMAQWGTCWTTSECVPRASMSNMCLKTHCKKTLLPEGIDRTTTP